MMPSPAFADIHRCTEPTTALINGTAIIPAPRSVKRPMSPSGIAVSTRSRINSEGTTERTEMMKIVPRTPARSHRYGRP